MLRVCRGSWIYIEEDEDLINFFFFGLRKNLLLILRGKKTKKSYLGM